MSAPRVATTCKASSNDNHTARGRGRRFADEWRMKAAGVTPWRSSVGRRRRSQDNAGLLGGLRKVSAEAFVIRRRQQASRSRSSASAKAAAPRSIHSVKDRARPRKARAHAGNCALGGKQKTQRGASRRRALDLWGQARKRQLSRWRYPRRTVMRKGDLRPCWQCGDIGERRILPSERHRQGRRPATRQRLGHLAESEGFGPKRFQAPRIIPRAPLQHQMHSSSRHPKPLIPARRGPSACESMQTSGT